MNWNRKLPRLKVLSGWDVVGIFSQFGFEVVSVRGSHAKLRRISATGERETLTVPLHPELDAGTCRAQLRLASRYIAFDRLKPYFFSE